MKAARIYVTCAIVVGILEIIDGALLILNAGLVNNFNITVTLIELTWFFVSLTFIPVFRRFKLSMLSPISFAVYILSGWTVASVIDLGQSTDAATVPFGFAIVGALFGIYYVIINEKLKGHFLRNDQGSLE